MTESSFENTQTIAEDESTVFPTTIFPVEKKPVLGVVDIVIIIFYIVVTFCVGIWASRSKMRNSVRGYFLAGQNMLWFPVGASLFASNIGTGHFIGLAGTGAASGIAVGAFEWIAGYNLLQLGWLFLPVYLSSKVYTMPEYLKKRFGGIRLRVTLSVISLSLYVLTKIAVDLYAGALFIQQALQINLYLAIVSLLMVTAVYTVLGGLKAVIYTDTIQSVVMLIGGILLMIVVILFNHSKKRVASVIAIMLDICFVYIVFMFFIGFVKVGGYEGLTVHYMDAIPRSTLNTLAAGNNTTCGIPRSDAFQLFRDPIKSDIPWPGMLLGIYFLGSWYWCTDQVIVQRALAAKDLNHAKIGCVLAGFLKVLPMYMIVMTGMISRVLFPNEVACADPDSCKEICGNSQGCSNIAYPMLVLELLPNGLRGIMVAAMLSALMSSLTSIFNSSSTIFTLDIWKRIRKSASERELLIVGKVSVCILVAISILWIPIILSSAGGQLYVYLQSIQSALGPPIFVLYLFAILWPRTNEQGAFWGLIGGFSIGVARLSLDFAFAAPPCDKKDNRPWILKRVNFLYVAPIVFVISCLITFIVTLCTKPLRQQHLKNTNVFGQKHRSPSNKNSKLDLQINEQKSKVDDFHKNEADSTLQMTRIPEEDKPCQQGKKKNTDDGTDDSIFAEVNSYDKTKNMKKWNNAINFLGIFLALSLTFLMGYYA